MMALPERGTYGRFRKVINLSGRSGKEDIGRIAYTLMSLHELINKLAIDKSAINKLSTFFGLLKLEKFLLKGYLINLLVKLVDGYRAILKFCIF